MGTFLSVCVCVCVCIHIGTKVFLTILRNADILIVNVINIIVDTWANLGGDTDT